MIVAARTWTRFIALGDSVTEGWCDPVVGDGAPWFGWADRLALSLDADSRAAGGPRLEFANLAVRGRRVRHVVDEQAPAARAMGGDLVSIQVGGNDLMSFRIDPDELAASLEEEGVSGVVISTARVSILPYLAGQTPPGVDSMEVPK